MSHSERRCCNRDPTLDARAAVEPVVLPPSRREHRFLHPRSRCRACRLGHRLKASVVELTSTDGRPRTFGAWDRSRPGPRISADKVRDAVGLSDATFSKLCRAAGHSPDGKFTEIDVEGFKSFGIAAVSSKVSTSPLRCRHSSLTESTSRHERIGGGSSGVGSLRRVVLRALVMPGSFSEGEARDEEPESGAVGCVESAVLLEELLHCANEFDEVFVGEHELAEVDCGAPFQIVRNE
jgi:hypothetical protein